MILDFSAIFENSYDHRSLSIIWIFYETFTLRLLNLLYSYNYSYDYIMLIGKLLLRGRFPTRRCLVGVSVY